MATRSAPVSPAAVHVVHSVVSADALLAEVARSYPLEMPTSCALIKLGLNDTYLVRARGERFVLRVYRSGWRSSVDIAYELEFLSHVASRGVSVSPPIACGDGSLTSSILVLEGVRRIALFPFAPGKPLHWRDEEQSRAVGRLLGEVHAGADDFASPPARNQLDTQHLIEASVANVRPFLERRGDDWAYLQGFASRLRTRVLGAADGGLDWGPCHGDFDAKNIHVDGQTLTVFDFDFCGAGWRAFDLVNARWQAERRRRPEMWRAFLNGYREVRNLSERDVAAVPLFAAVRHLWGMGRRASEVPFRGSSRLSNEYLGYRLAGFRRWEAEYPS